MHPGFSAQSAPAVMPLFLRCPISTLPQSRSVVDSLGLVAPHFMYRSLHFISELGAVDFGDGALHTPSRTVDAADHGSPAFGIHCPREVRQLHNLDLVALHFMYRSLDLISESRRHRLRTWRISDKPSRIVDAADHGSRAFDFHCPGRGPPTGQP